MKISLKTFAAVAVLAFASSFAKSGDVGVYWGATKMNSIGSSEFGIGYQANYARVGFAINNFTSGGVSFTGLNLSLHGKYDYAINSQVSAYGLAGADFKTMSLFGLDVIVTSFQAGVGAEYNFSNCAVFGELMLGTPYFGTAGKLVNGSTLTLSPSLHVGVLVH